jgi:hypothetical protein
MRFSCRELMRRRLVVAQNDPPAIGGGSIGQFVKAPRVTAGRIGTAATWRDDGVSDGTSLRFQNSAAYDGL